MMHAGPWQCSPERLCDTEPTTLCYLSYYGHGVWRILLLLIGHAFAI